MKEPLSNERILELTKQAYQNNEMVELLSGTGEYENPLDRWTPGNVPTDVGRVLEQGIYTLYQSTNDNELILAYKSAICKLLSGTPLQVWLGYDTCWYQLYNEQKEKSPFKIITSELIDIVKDALTKNQHELTLIHEFEGAGQKQGLWQDITRSNNVLAQKFGVTFL